LEDGNLGVLSDITTAFKVFAFIIGILSLISGKRAVNSRIWYFDI
jgi:hypothetical protein